LAAAYFSEIRTRYFFSSKIPQKFKPSPFTEKKPSPFILNFYANQRPAHNLQLQHLLLPTPPAQGAILKVLGQVRRQAEGLPTPGRDL
jgi:hypothetical protein